MNVTKEQFIGLIKILEYDVIETHNGLNDRIVTPTGRVTDLRVLPAWIEPYSNSLYGGEANTIDAKWYFIDLTVNREEPYVSVGHLMFMNHSIRLPKLRLWNGRPVGVFTRNPNYPNAHISIAATSKAEAKRLLEKACKCTVNKNEINEYYHECWGSSMDLVIPIKPGVWVTSNNKYPVKII